MAAPALLSVVHHMERQIRPNSGQWRLCNVQRISESPEMKVSESHPQNEWLLHIKIHSAQTKSFNGEHSATKPQNIPAQTVWWERDGAPAQMMKLSRRHSQQKTKLPETLQQIQTSGQPEHGYVSVNCGVQWRSKPGDSVPVLPIASHILHTTNECRQLSYQMLVKLEKLFSFACGVQKKPSNI